MKFDLSVLEVGILCTGLFLAREHDLLSLDNLDDVRFPNMRRILNYSVEKKTDLINRLDLLVNTKT